MVYGYDSRVVNEFGLRQMREVTVATKPEVLRTLAAFLLDAATELESSEVSAHWHKHASRELARAMGCDFIIAAAKPEFR